MTYTRPDAESTKQHLAALTEQLKTAKSYEEARKVFLAQQEQAKHISTASTLASVRHSIDTRDTFYDAEEKFWNSFFPELEEYNQAWTAAMLESPFRAEFAEEFGDLMFVNAELALKTFSPEIIPEMQQENELTQEYEKLLASAQIPFEGKVYTLSQLSPFKTCADDEKRLAAWKAEGQWYKDNQAKFDELYDKLVKLRDAMGKKLGYEGYTTLGYYRMVRNCYTKEDIETFRAAVVKYLVPVADKVYREQAKRLGKSYPMSFADNALEFRSGNPRPVGTPDYNLQQGSAVLPDICRSVCSNFVFSGSVSSWKGKAFSGTVSACDNCGCIYRRCVSVLEKGPCALRERRFVSCVCEHGRREIRHRGIQP